MSLTKTLAAAAAVSLLLGVSAAEAAKPKPKKPVCNLMKDAKGDATGTGLGVEGPNDPNLDLVSADIATNATTLTAVFRVASLGSSGDTSPAGRSYEVTFVVKGQPVTVRATTTPAGNTWQDGKGTGVVDTAKKEIRVHVPLAALGVPLKASQKVTDLLARTWRWGGPTTISLGMVDRASGASSYTIAWPSCVKVGK